MEHCKRSIRRTIGLFVVSRACQFRRRTIARTLKGSTATPTHTRTFHAVCTLNFLFFFAGPCDNSAQASKTELGGLPRFSPVSPPAHLYPHAIYDGCLRIRCPFSLSPLSIWQVGCHSTYLAPPTLLRPFLSRSRKRHFDGFKKRRGSKVDSIRLIAFSG